LRWVREWFGAELGDIRLIRSGKRRIRALSPEADDLEVRDVVRGVYLAKKAPYGYIISVEGSFIVGRSAKRHVVELDPEEFRRWMRGEDLRVVLPERGVYLVRHGPVFAGSGYYDGNKLKNLLPRSRTVEGGG